MIHRKEINGFKPFFFSDLPLGHAVHAPHGSAVAVDAAVWWRINSWWGRSAWRGANSFQFHVAGLRVFLSHSRSSVLYVTVWILVHLCHTTNTRLYRFVVLSCGILECYWMMSYKIHTRSRSRFIFYYLGHLLLEHVYKSLTHSFINLLMCDRLGDMSNIAVFLTLRGSKSKRQILKKTAGLVKWRISYLHVANVFYCCGYLKMELKCCKNKRSLLVSLYPAGFDTRENST